MADKALPTITLAELYESQNQYVDALVIYKNLYKENPSEEMMNKIDELKDIIFKENTLEYASITDKLFTDEEKRLFQILPHEQYKAYKDSLTELDNEETFPEELTDLQEEPVIKEPDVPEELEEDILEEDDEIEVSDEPEGIELKDKLEIETNDDLVPDIEEQAELESDEKIELTPIEGTNEEEELLPEDINLKEFEENIKLEEDLNEKEIEQEHDEDDDELEEQIEDDISLDAPLINDDEVENSTPEIKAEEHSVFVENEISDLESEEITSIEDIVKKQVEEKSEVNDLEENIEEENIKLEEDSNDEEIEQEQEENDDHILDLLNSLSKLRPDIVERVLKENVGDDASLADIKLSDLHYVVELLKLSENVERKD